MGKGSENEMKEILKKRPKVSIYRMLDLTKTSGNFAHKGDIKKEKEKRMGPRKFQTVGLMNQESRRGRGEGGGRAG